MEVEARADGQPTVLDLRLPETEVQVTVLNADGQPVDGAQVIAVSPKLESKVLEAWSDDNGELTVEGLVAEEIALVAFSDQGVSPKRVVRVEEGRVTGPIVLKLDRLKKVKTRILAADRPVPYASVQYKAPGREPRFGKSNVDGSLELTVPDTSTFVDLLVLPVDRTADLVRLSVDQADAPAVHLGYDAGALVFDTGDHRLRDLVIFHDGLEIPTVDPFLRWAARLIGVDIRQGAPVAVSRMSSGHYLFCPKDEIAGTNPTSNVIPSGCAGGYLAPGGRLDLKLQSLDESDF